MRSPGLRPYRDAADDTIERCRTAAKRIGDGLELISTDSRAAEAFRFMNRAMWLQRVRTIYSEAVRRGEKPKMEEIDVPERHTWYPFQMAFILMCLPGITDLGHPDRTDPTKATADLLWYPTGGGKTERHRDRTGVATAVSGRRSAAVAK